MGKVVGAVEGVGVGVVWASVVGYERKREDFEIGIVWGEEFLDV